MFGLKSLLSVLELLESTNKFRLQLRGKAELWAFSSADKEDLFHRDLKKLLPAHPQVYFETCRKVYNESYNTNIPTQNKNPSTMVSTCRRKGCLQIRIQPGEGGAVGEGAVDV
eukprot:scaffold7386_cov160-Amphora_coffeaeformis.AAC.1